MDPRLIELGRAKLPDNFAGQQPARDEGRAARGLVGQSIFSIRNPAFTEAQQGPAMIIGVLFMRWGWSSNSLRAGPTFLLSGPLGAVIPNRRSATTEIAGRTRQLSYNTSETRIGAAEWDTGAQSAVL